jgi:hypothetical protein
LASFAAAQGCTEEWLELLEREYSHVVALARLKAEAQRAERLKGED